MSNITSGLPEQDALGAMSAKLPENKGILDYVRENLPKPEDTQQIRVVIENKPGIREQILRILHLR